MRIENSVDESHWMCALEHALAHGKTQGIVKFVINEINVKFYGFFDGAVIQRNGRACS